jgi:hypothetical protein
LEVQARKYEAAKKREQVAEAKKRKLGMSARKKVACDDARRENEAVNAHGLSAVTVPAVAPVGFPAAVDTLMEYAAVPPLPQQYLLEPSGEFLGSDM